MKPIQPTRRRYDASASSRARSGPSPYVLLASAVMVPYFVPSTVGLLVLSAVLVLGLLVLRSRTSRDPQRRDWPLGLVFGSVLLIGLVGESRGGAAIYDLVLLGLCIPVAYSIGVRFGGIRELRVAFLRAVVVIALIGAVIGVMEFLTQSYLLHGPSLIDASSRNGSLRSRGFSPHPLVLALVSVVAVPLAASREVMPPLTVRAAAVTMLVAGASVTGSRSALPVLVTGFAFALIWSRAIKAQSRTYLMVVLFAAATLVAGPAVIGLYSSDSSVVTATDPDVASQQYRAELYRNLPDLLESSPLGTGLGEVPVGHLVIQSSLGAIDLSKTVDSEFVLSATKFGLIGLLLWTIVVARVLRSMQPPLLALDVAVLVALGFGTILALQAWASAAVILAMLIGLQRGQRATPLK